MKSVRPCQLTVVFADSPQGSGRAGSSCVPEERVILLRIAKVNVTTGLAAQWSSLGPGR